MPAVPHASRWPIGICRLAETRRDRKVRCRATRLPTYRTLLAVPARPILLSDRNRRRLPPQLGPVHRPPQTAHNFGHAAIIVPQLERAAFDWSLLRITSVPRPRSPLYQRENRQMRLCGSHPSLWITGFCERSLLRRRRTLPAQHCSTAALRPACAQSRSFN